MKIVAAALLLPAVLLFAQDHGMPGQSEPGMPGQDIPAPMPCPPPAAMISGVAITAHDGFLFVVKNDMIYKVDPKTLKVLARAMLDEAESTESHPAQPIQPVPMPMPREPKK